MKSLKAVLTSYSDENTEPYDSTYNDTFIRPYFYESRKAMAATLSSTIVIAREKSVTLWE